MKSKTLKPAPDPDRKNRPVQKKQAESTRTLPAVQAFQQENASHHPIQKKENNTGLPDNLKTGIENISGFSMDDVKVHYNSDKPAQLNALAYAQGNNIHIGAGQERHLPHEAWHVVQQKQGRVNATMQMKGIAINDDSALEKEADVMGAKAAQLVKQPNAQPLISRSPGGHLLQPAWDKTETEHQLRWSEQMAGLRWYYDDNTGEMYFLIEDRSKIAPQKIVEAESLQGTRKSHGNWLKLGWGLVPVTKTEFKETIGSLINTGKRRYQRIEDKNRLGGPKKLSDEIQQTRSWFFNNYYNTYKTGTNFQEDGRVSKEGSDPENLTSDYKYRPDSMPKHEYSKKGRYTNQYPLNDGKIIADQNYDFEGGEQFYNPVEKKPEKISNSEIIYQQWKQAKQAINYDGTKLKKLKRSHIAGPDGKAVIKIVREALKAPANKTTEYAKGTDGFFALLAAPNSIAALWLVLDHGDEMGIHDIESVTLLTGNSIEINFS